MTHRGRKGRTELSLVPVVDVRQQRPEPPARLRTNSIRWDVPSRDCKNTGRKRSIAFAVGKQKQTSQ